ncbi:hypothetical protein SRHO_G00069980 [Serrasalmus rhombeus]
MDVEKAVNSQASQQPAAGEKASEAPLVPAGLESGSLGNISAVMPEKTGTPLHEDFQTSEDIPEASSDLWDTSLDQIEAEVEAEVITPLTSTESEEQEAINQPLAGKLTALIHVKTENVELKMTTAEAIEQLMNIYLDETEDSMEQHLGSEGMNVINTEPEAPTLNMEMYLDDMDTPNDHPLEEEMLEVMDTEDEAEVIKDLHLELQDTGTEYLGDEMFEATLTEAEVEAVKHVMLLFIDKIEAESMGCEASGVNMQTHLDGPVTPDDHPLDVEKMSDAETDWNCIKCLMADQLSDVEGTVDHSLGNEMHKVTDAEAEADDLNNLMDIQLDKTEATVQQALGKDAEMKTDPEPIKSWADIIEETEGTINQSGE